MSFVLEAQTRIPGKGSELTEIRTNSKVPAVVYGFERDSQAITVDYSSLIKVLKEAGTSNVINLKINDQDLEVIVKTYDQDPVTDKVTHVDFLITNKTRPLTTIVPIHFVGMSKAVKEQGGKLNIKNEQVLVKCLPADLPAVLTIDLAILENLGQSILVKDIPVSDQVTVLTNANDPVVAVGLPRKAKVEAATVEAAAAPEAKAEADTEKKKTDKDKKDK